MPMTKQRPAGERCRRARLPVALTAAALGLFLGAGCGGNANQNKNQIAPVVAALDIPSPPTADPVVYLRPSAADTDSGDDMVILDVMLRMGTPVPFDGYTLELLFDPGILQAGQIDVSGSPFGDCSQQVVCLEGDNVTEANSSGDLLIGVGVTQSGSPVTPSSSDTPLLTVAFVTASTGTSAVAFPPPSPGRGDCEILLGNNEVVPSIPCDDGGASITGSN